MESFTENTRNPEKHLYSE